MMKYQETAIRFTPEFTPRVIRNIIILTVVLTLFSALMEPFFFNIFGISGPQDWLTLSWHGLSRWSLWEPISYLFVLPEGFQGITLSLLISLAFQMYMVWILGTPLCHSVGSKAFFYFYFFIGIVSGLLALLVGPGYYLAGPGPVILALMTVWMMTSAESELLFLLMFPVKVKWITVGTLGAIFLIYLSSMQLTYMVFYLSGAIFGYIYAAVNWQLQSPFACTSTLDRKLHALGQLLHLKKAQTKDSSKIIDFKTGEPDISDDDRFVDVMLTKISKYGQKSLSWSERRRLDAISKRKSGK